ncbi:hypothetical protein BVX94_01590 [bacterium B17]|nr:hypothetical protein BVX94_01590 [bacterium B17]
MITIDTVSNTQYMVELDLNTMLYKVLRCRWHNFDNWIIHPEYFYEGANTMATRTWSTNLNDWVEDSMEKLQNFQDNPTWSTCNTYIASSPFYYTEDGGWRLKHGRIIENAGTDDLSPQGQAVELDGTYNNSSMIYITDTNRTEGAEKLEFDYRVSDTNLYMALYPFTGGWPTNGFKIAFSGGSTYWPEKYNRNNGHISCYYLYQDASNYFEARLSPQYDSGQNRVEYEGSLRKVVNGTVTDIVTNRQNEAPLKQWIISVSETNQHTFSYNDNTFVGMTLDAAPFADFGELGFGARDMDFVVSNDLVVFDGEFTNMTPRYYTPTNDAWSGWANVSTSAAPWIASTNFDQIARIGHTGMVQLLCGSADLVVDTDVEYHTLWDVRKYISVTNLHWQTYTFNVQTSETVTLPIMLGNSMDYDVHIDNIKTYGWHGQSNRTADGWVSSEAWITTNGYGATENRSIDLQMSRRLPPTEQYILSPLLRTIGSMNFRCYTPNNKPATLELQIAETVPSNWETLHTVTIQTNTWTTLGWPINTNINGYLRILHTSEDNEAWLRIDDINISANQDKATNAWYGYNFLTTDRTNGVTDIFQLFREEGQSAHLNYDPQSNVYNNARLNRYIPHVRSPYLDKGIGNISFWYRNWSVPGDINAGNLKVQVSWYDRGPWTTIDQIDTLSDSYQHYSTNMYDADSRYVRIVNDNQYNIPDRLSIDNLLITEPFKSDLTMTNMVITPEQPLHLDEVTARIELTDHIFGVSNVNVTLHFKTGESIWGVWTTNDSIAVPMTCIDTNFATNPPVYTYETIGTIPSLTNITDTVVQYMIQATFDGRWFPEVASPKDHKDFTNPTWYYPVDLNTNNAVYSNPYYVVFSCPPGSVWINEIDAADEGDVYTSEFVELAGGADFDISNWKIQLMDYDKSIYHTYTVDDGTFLANAINGYGFWVLGDPGVPYVKQLLTEVLGAEDPDQHLPLEGGVRLIRSMGAYEHSVAYSSPIPWPGFDNIYTDDGWDFLDFDGSIQLYGAGTNRDDFSGIFTTNIVATPGTINYNQDLLGSYLELLITDLWMTGSTVYMEVIATTNITPTIWSATNLADVNPWTQVTNISYTNSGNTYTNWFDLQTNEPALFYRVTTTN